MKADTKTFYCWKRYSIKKDGMRVNAWEKSSGPLCSISYHFSFADSAGYIIFPFMIFRNGVKRCFETVLRDIMSNTSIFVSSERRR